MSTTELEGNAPTTPDGGLGALSRRLELRRARSTYAQPASERDIHALHSMLREQFDGRLAPVEAACRIQRISPNSIWSVYGPEASSAASPSSRSTASASTTSSPAGSISRRRRTPPSP